ncbi:GerAB/ArcD/ProY family transporter [Bacillus rubiinfantis]|uniref:GerAB/ArcD/ProY family transporter n=1 Tax=Bacillus rubiinfantis TaxID=1499680 RepID=UPI0005A7341F|nr:GerAB/ArcD/ProY family transporter [Bacillus rubiinfantis]
MNRYYLYLVVLNMVMNVIVFVPKILIEYRFNGAVMSVLIAIPIGFALNIIFTKSINRFPGKGFTELVENSNKKWIVNTCLSILPLAWFTAGLITLLGFSDILTRFINPEAPKLEIIAIYLVGTLFIMTMPTERVMYFLEIVLFLNLPLIAFLILKTYTSDYLVWDSILEVGTHIFEWPNLKAIAAASYVFSGYANLMIFNRTFKGKIKLRNFFAVLCLGIVTLFTSFLVPIGFHGADGAQEYLYPWISTADSIRLVYGPIERAIFLFIAFYMTISLMSIAVHWHVAFQLIRGIYKESRKKDWLVLAGFVSITLIAGLVYNTVELNIITSYWMIFRLSFEIIVVGLFFIWARRHRSENH